MPWVRCLDVARWYLAGDRPWNGIAHVSVKGHGDVVRWYGHCRSHSVFLVNLVVLVTKFSLWYLQWIGLRLLV